MHWPVKTKQSWKLFAKYNIYEKSFIEKYEEKENGSLQSGLFTGLVDLCMFFDPGSECITGWLQEKA